MNAKQFSEGLGEIEEKYIAEAVAVYPRKSSLGKAAALAACAALVIAAVLIPTWLGREEALLPAGDGGYEELQLFFNQIAQPSGGANLFDLSGEDFVPMSYEEVLAYFQVTLPVDAACPTLSLVGAPEGGGFGRFASESRGTYYDGNTVLFSDGTGRQQVAVGLEKVWRCSGLGFQLTEEPLRFSAVNGRELALFRYQDEEGNDCCYVEFVQNDVAFLVRMQNLSSEDVARCLQALVEERPGEGTVHTVTGEVTAVDPYANHIGVDGEDGIYGVNLPEELPAEGFSLGNVVRVTYTGEPATIDTIWAQQLLEIEPEEQSRRGLEG